MSSISKCRIIYDSNPWACIPTASCALRPGSPHGFCRLVMVRAGRSRARASTPARQRKTPVFGLACAGALSLPEIIQVPLCHCTASELLALCFGFAKLSGSLFEGEAGKGDPLAAIRGFNFSFEGRTPSPGTGPELECCASFQSPSRKTQVAASCELAALICIEHLLKIFIAPHPGFSDARIPGLAAGPATTAGPSPSNSWLVHDPQSRGLLCSGGC